MDKRNIQEIIDKKKNKLWDWEEPTFGKCFVLAAGSMIILLVSWKLFLILVGTVFVSAFIYLIWITLIL